MPAPFKPRRTSRAASHDALCRHRYVGGFKANQKEGPGVLTQADGTVYEGTYLAGRRVGRGIERGTDGSVYDGEWTHGKKEGEGKFTYPDGSFFEGQWKQVMWPAPTASSYT
jgi:hypothetical protein